MLTSCDLTRRVISRGMTDGRCHAQADCNGEADCEQREPHLAASDFDALYPTKKRLSLGDHQLSLSFHDRDVVKPTTGENDWSS